MNPYHHALSSANKHGAGWKDFYNIHYFLDNSKSALCHFKHRAVYHHQEGIDEYKRLFGEGIKHSEGVATVNEVGEQHLLEDHGLVPTIEMWMEGCTFLDNEKKEMNLNHIAKRVSAKTADLVKLAELFWPTPAILRCHSFGIFEVERMYGPAYELASGRKVPTRYICELIVAARFGAVPSLSDWAAHIVGRDWMSPRIHAEEMLNTLAKHTD